MAHATYAYSYSADVSFTSDYTLSYALTTTPSANWLTLDAANQKISGTPTNAAVATYVVTLKATDQLGTTETSYDLEVTENFPAAATTPSDESVIGFLTYSKDFSALFSDPEGDPLTVAFSSTASFLSWNSDTLQLSGTPTNAHIGDYTITLTAS